MEIIIGEWRLRSWAPNDISALVRYANNRNVWINLYDLFPHPYTEEDARSWIGRNEGQSPLTNFAIASAHEAIGGIGLTLHRDGERRTAMIGYWLGEPFWGRRIATSAVRAIAEYAFATFDLVRLYGKVFDWNSASVRVLEKCGFTFEGRLRKSVTKDGKTIGTLMYALVKEEALARIHRRRASGQCPEAARGCSCESGI